MRKILTCLFLLLLFSVVSTAVPSQIAFQGLLKDSAGNPITGSRTVVFNIYPTATGAGSLWTETQTVSVEVGLYSVQLGSTTPLTSTIFDGTTKYLAVSIGGTELLPRVVIVTVPYALRADRATYADTAGSSGGIPNAVLFNPTTKQATTDAAPAVWVSINKSGIDAYRMTVAISAETSGTMFTAAVGGLVSNPSASRTAGVIGMNLGTGPYNRGVLGMVMGAGANGVEGNSEGTNSVGVYGKANDVTSFGVYGDSSQGIGVYGESEHRIGIYGIGEVAGGSFEATGNDGVGVTAITQGTNGGEIGVKGISYSTAISGLSTNGRAYYGRSDNPGGGAVAYFEHLGTNGDGVFAQASGSGLSGYFHGGQGICVDTNTFAESSTREGTISYVDGKFWGFTSGGWKQLDN